MQKLTEYKYALLAAYNKFGNKNTFNSEDYRELIDSANKDENAYFAELCSIDQV